MLITFRSKASSNITMFGEAALTLLQMMGHSGTVPGALLEGEIPAALARLRQALHAAGPEIAEMQSTQPPSGNPQGAPAVTLQLRAHPLLELLTAAAAQECAVTWDRERPVL